MAEVNELVSDESDTIVSEVTERVDRGDGLLRESDAATINVLSATFTTNYVDDDQVSLTNPIRAGDCLPVHVGMSTPTQRRLDGRSCDVFDR